MDFPASDGIGLSTLIMFLAVLVCAYALSKTILFIIKRTAKAFASKTKTILDDLLIDAIDLPLTMGVVGASVYAAAFFSGLGGLPIVDLASKEFVILLGAFSTYKIMAAFLHWYVVEVAPKKNLPLADMETTIKRVGALFIIAMALIMALDTAGIEVSPLLASLGIAGLAVALAFQDTLSNFFSGVYISLDRPIREKDYILLESGHEGYVEKIGWRSTSIRMPANNLIVVPNTKLASSIITNFHTPAKPLSIKIPSSVSYDSDLEKVERITLDVARKIQQKFDYVDKTFEPRVRFTAFADSGVSFDVILRANEYMDKFPLTHEFIKELHARYRKEGIEIPYPKRDLYLHPAGKKKR